MNKAQLIRVLVIDDSAVIRRMICTALSSEPEIAVVGTAADPYEAKDLIELHKPDVLTLDINMPRMNGLTFLRILKEHHPIPVIVITSLNRTNDHIATEARSLGAFDVLTKPTSSQGAAQFAKAIHQTIRSAFNTRDCATTCNPSSLVDDNRDGMQFDPRQLILIGASTGGPEALREILAQLPATMPPILIAQHIPASFSRAFAGRMNGLSKLSVREAADGDALAPGLALLAPGDYHLRVSWEGHCFRVHLDQTPPVNHCRPSVDVLFNSAALCKHAKIVACILTGMGSDGANGMKALKEMGAKTMIQDEEGCIVFGMPKAARNLGVVDHSVPLSRISQELIAAANTIRSD